MKRVTKGTAGYIAYQKKVGMIRSIICLIVVVGMFLAGLIHSGSNKNALSIIAAVGCLPTGWSIVNMIMYLQAKPISGKAAEEIQKHAGKLYLQYELYLTSPKHSFPVAAITVLDKNIAGYMEDENSDASDLQEHIKLQISQSGYHDYTIKIYDDLASFCKRLDELEKLREVRGLDPVAEEEAWVPGTLQTVSGILNSISL